ncbi:MAG TPA: hypothetical protein IAB30_08000 [Candidatus Fimenecus excrementavium]|mgnify:FL=1|nr:hypothetical protein [Candidatus Fimenecus excrementavium]
MRRELVETIKESTKVLFLNFETTLKTCDMDYVLCDMPIWKHCYHTLHSLDQWFINPYEYTEPPFHEDKLNSLNYLGEKVLSRDELTDYFKTIQVKLLAYLDSLNDEDLYEIPKGCKYNRLEHVLGQFRHFHCHMGNINATTIVTTNQWPRVVGTYALDKDFVFPGLYE